MPGLRSSGALWLDLTLLGSAFLALLLLYPLVLFTNASQTLDPSFRAFVIGFTAIGIGIIAIGVGVGKRTGWKVPDPERPRTR